MDQSVDQGPSGRTRAGATSRARRLRRCRRRRPPRYLHLSWSSWRLFLCSLLFVAAVRLFGPRFVDYHGVVVVAEPPITAIDRVQRAVEAQPKYTFRRVGTSRIEVIHSSVPADEHATQPMPAIAGIALDRLVATATPSATGTEVTLVGRAEPRLINAVRTELGHAPAPRLQRSIWKGRP